MGWWCGYFYSLWNRKVSKKIKKKDFSKFGLEIHHRLDLIKIYLEGKQYPFVDVWRSFESEDKIHIKVIGKNFFHNKNELYPLKYYDIGPIKIKGANNYDDFLKLRYGNDWNYNIYFKFFAHVKDKYIGIKLNEANKYFKLTPKLRNLHLKPSDDLLNILENENFKNN